MNLRIRRRRFGQIVLASAATTALSNFAGKAIAQNPSSVIYGFSVANAADNLVTSTVNSLVRINTVDSLVKNVDVLNLAKSTPEITVTALDTLSGKVVSTVKLLSTVVENVRLNLTKETATKAVYTNPVERLTGVTTLSNGSFVAASVLSSSSGDFTRLSVIDPKSSRLQKGLRVSGFESVNSTIESLLAIKGDNLISIVSLNAGTPPFVTAGIDIQTGRIVNGAKFALPELSDTKRYSNLTQTPDGKIYATSLDHEGVTTLVEFDLDDLALVTGRGKIKQVAQLNFQKATLGNDLLSLACSPSGQVFAIANIQSQKLGNSLYNIDLKSGELQLVRQVPFAKIAFGR
ncbi:MAG: hypothetical protein KME21_06070 [Desmonostoc vinosum HA7617-LM4]|nr:hypothetical protein [Desmonostoc vinosum HA7617-LM4]